ncbi:MAG: cellulase family glycosylhydrolase [Candidatus Limiplasma sp.]|nr:cellulase family glycosylhydrolase [Candidatus Limiplasma sp.]
MKKTILLLCCILFCFASIAYGESTAQALQSRNDEIERAVSLGIAEEKDDNPAVTYAEFFAMLDRVVELTGTDKGSEWQAQWSQARASNAEMTRFEGMMAVLKCGVALGGDYAAFNADWGPLNEKIGEKVWDEIGRIPEPFRLIPNEYPFQGGGFENDRYIYEWDDCGVAYRYAFGRASLKSDRTLFEYDETENSMLPDKPFVYQDAILAALRLYESSEKQTHLIPVSNEISNITARVVVNGTVHTFTGYEKGGDYYFTQADIETALGGANFTGAKTHGKDGVDYYALQDTAVNAGYDFTHDEVLTADYIWTYPQEEMAGAGDDEMDRAAALGIVQGKEDTAAVTYAEFFSMLDRVVELADADKLSAWQAMFPQARKSDEEMTRFEGMMAALKCAVALGDDYAEFNADWLRLNNIIGEKVWDEIDRIPEPFRLIPNDYPFVGGGFKKDQTVYDWDDCGVAYRYAFGRISLLSGKTLFDYNEAENSMLPDKPLTYHDAALAAVRLRESAALASSFIPLSDPRAVAYDKSIITDALLERATALPALSKEDIPVFKGLIFGGNYETTSMPVSGAELRTVANWGFHSARVMLTFQTLFDMDVQSVVEVKLKQLDKLVAAAISNNLHLNIVTFSMPGRWVTTDSSSFTSVGEFDLFINSKRQEEANAIWALLAQRYQDIPSAVLSFSPLWEAQNPSLSTGLPCEPYTAADVAGVYDQLIGTIRQYDPDRMILYEPTPANGAQEIIRDSKVIQSMLENKYPDVLMMLNFCDGPFVYACMTAQEGEHIDNNNHSMFIPDYPVKIYAAQRHIRKGKPLEMTGELAAGTQIDIYLREVKGKGTFEILADGKKLYSERLSSKQYEVGYPLSGYYPFAKSDKQITVLLESDADKLEIRYSGSWFDWCGINVTLPEKYAVERWWFPTDYDAMLEGTQHQNPYLKKTSTVMLSPNSEDAGRKITIDPEVTYTSEAVWEQSTKETIDAWAKEIADFAPNAVVRFENANFGGCTQQAALRYYDDLLSALDQYGFGWLSNDYINIVNNGGGYVGATMAPYGNGSINVELLKLLQKWQ